MERSYAQPDQCEEQREMEPSEYHVFDVTRRRLWRKLQQIIPCGFLVLATGNPAAREGVYYSTTKGADCAISCFEISSFTLIVTLYLPG
jgi:hypothetical protein